MGSWCLRAHCVLWFVFSFHSSVANSFDFPEILSSDYPTAEAQFFGTAIAGGSDADGDGYDDFIIGDPTGDGHARVVSGLTGKTLAYFENTCVSPVVTFCPFSFGRSVAFLGDLDGDGLPEIAVGSAKFRASGNIDIYKLTGQKLLHIEDEASQFSAYVNSPAFFAYYSNVGYRIINLGDVNGDGFSDFAATATGFSHIMSSGGVTTASTTGAGSTTTGTGNPAPPFAGEVRVYSGNLSENGKILYKFEAAPHWTSPTGINPPPPGSFMQPGDELAPGAFPEFARFGETIAALGDLNDDGITDFVVGGSRGVLGQVRVFVSNSASGNDLFQVEHEYFSFLEGDEYGAAVANTGDRNGDGIDDFVVGAPSDDTSCSGCDDYGKLYFYSGADGSLIFSATGNELGGSLFRDSRFGSSILSYPPSHWEKKDAYIDRDGDGIPSIVVGAPGLDLPSPDGLIEDMGAVTYLDLNSSAWLMEFSIQEYVEPFQEFSAQSHDQFGSTLAYAGPGIGNGTPQVLIGSSQDKELLADGVTLRTGTVFRLNLGEHRKQLLVDRSDFALSEINSIGQSLEFTIDAGEDNAGNYYWLIGNSTGTQPGTPIPGTPLVFPLNSWSDTFFDFSLSHSNTEALEDNFGVIDENGFARARVHASPTIDQAILGTELGFAFLVLDQHFHVLDVSTATTVVFE